MSTMVDTFEAEFAALTGLRPFRWQARLFRRFANGDVPSAVDHCWHRRYDRLAPDVLRVQRFGENAALPCGASWGRRFDGARRSASGPAVCPYAASDQTGRIVLARGRGRP